MKILRSTLVATAAIFAAAAMPYKDTGPSVATANVDQLDKAYISQPLGVAPDIVTSAVKNFQTPNIVVTISNYDAIRGIDLANVGKSMKQIEPVGNAGALEQTAKTIGSGDNSPQYADTGPPEANRINLGFFAGNTIPRYGGAQASGLSPALASARPLMTTDFATTRSATVGVRTLTR